VTTTSKWSINKPSEFDGSEESYFPWLTRFTAFAAIKKFETVIDPELRTQSYHLLKYLQQAQMIKVASRMAMYPLTLCLISQKSLRAIYKSRANNFPNDLALLVMKSLKERYAPLDRVSQIGTKRQLTTVKMGEKNNPATMFEEFHWLANLFNDPATEAIISPDDLWLKSSLQPWIIISQCSTVSQEAKQPSLPYKIWNRQ
jgi:hypothetical protein